jgi:hypothetical protein
MIELVLTICALTFASPYYDCSEEWDIIVYDESEGLLYCGNEEPRSLGCSGYDRLLKNDYIELVYNHDEIMGKHTGKIKGGGILQHELLHQMCECNWHEKWDKTNPDIRKHRFSQLPKVPEKVIPYLKDKWV